MKFDERSYNVSLRQKERLLKERPRASVAGGEISTVIAYANRYWIAMSNLGFQAIYRLLTEDARLKVERAYLPEADEAEWRTFESNSRLANAEILAVSVSFETDYPYVLRLLEAAGISLDECREGSLVFREDGPLVLGGGAALTLNPEPLANVFDAIVIGEGEEVISEVVSCYAEWRHAARKDLLRALAQIDGVYVPSLYRPQYKSDHTIAGFSVDTEVPARVQRRFVEDIDRFPTYTVLQTPETEFRSMFMTETGRGCEIGCRFCVAGYMYRPIRKRSAEVIESTVQIGIESSDSIGFVGAAVSSHPKISELARGVAEKGKRASLSSIMSQRVTPELAASLSESEYKTVALAPEAGSEALRFRIGKRVCNEQVVSAVATLAEQGIRNFKLYFMVGLPSEEEEDVLAIAELAKQARDAALEAARKQSDFRIAPTLFLSVNPFIPKAWTPFQRHGFLDFHEIKRRIEIVRRGIATIPNVEMKFESPRESYFQALMSRGDRRVGDMLIELHRAELDWRSVVRRGDEQIVDSAPPPDFYVHRMIGKEEILPWEIVDLRIKRTLLEREYERTFQEDVTPLRERARRQFFEEHPA